jgi:hypothetical protein
LQFIDVFHAVIDIGPAQGNDERELDGSVEGVVVSNGPLHERILAAVVQARAEKAAVPV